MCQNKVQIIKGNELEPLFGHHQKFDFFISAIPWGTISKSKLNALPTEQQTLYRSFYDLDNQLINSLLKHSWSLMKNNSSIFITACDNILERINNFCKLYQIRYKIINDKDIHNDGNTHLILKLNKFY